MDKINITLELPEFKDKEFEGFSFKVKNYISLEDKIEIVGAYIDALFAEDDIVENYLEAQYSLMLSVVDKCTNISIDNENIIRKLESTGLWNEIENSIVGYYEFLDELENIVDLKEYEFSVSSNMNILILKVIDWLENISKLDLSENGVNSILESFNELTNNVNDLRQTLGDHTQKRGRGRPKKNE